MKVWTLFGMVACTVGCLCLYLSSQHQRLLARPWPARAARTAGAGLLVLSGWALAQDLQRLTAAYVVVTLAMLLLALLPYLGAWRALHRRG